MSLVGPVPYFQDATGPPVQDCWRRLAKTTSIRVPSIGTGIAAAPVGTDPAKPRLVAACTFAD